MGKEQVTITPGDVGVINLSTRVNLHDESGAYVTTVRASSEEEAIAKGKESHPTTKLVLGPRKGLTLGRISLAGNMKPGAKVNKPEKKNAAGVRFNLRDESGAYVTTVRANSPEEALKKAGSSHPGVKLSATQKTARRK